MMEESLTIYRIRRTPDRLKWKIDVGLDTPQDEAMEICNTFKSQIRKKMLLNPETGELKGELDPLSLDEDIVIPISEGSLTDVSVMAGSTQVGHVLDIEYMRKRLFSCLRIPPDYMGFADAPGTLTARSSLSDQDIQFARQEKRLQRGAMVGTVQLFKIDLALRGINPDAPQNAFEVHMNPVSFLDELQQAEVAKVRAGTVSLLLDVGERLGADTEAWRKYVLSLSGFPMGAMQLDNSDLSDSKQLVAALTRHIEDTGGLFGTLPGVNGSFVSSKGYPLKWHGEGSPQTLMESNLSRLERYKKGKSDGKREPTNTESTEVSAPLEEA